MKTPPDFEKIPLVELEQATLVEFDLETISLSDSCEIIQIAATVFNSSSSFDRYILPVGSISPGASKVSGITKKNNRLFLRSRPVECADILTTLKQFISEKFNGKRRVTADKKIISKVCEYFSSK